MVHILAGFLAGSMSDHRGRILSDIINWNYDQLENSHDFVQWLFPLPEESQAVPFAPVMSDEAAKEISTNEKAQLGLITATLRMCEFYGIPIEVDVTPHKLATQRDDHRIAAWCSHRNHNFLRMTRILRSLSLLGQGVMAKNILSFILNEIHPHYPAVSAALPYWMEAVKGEKVWPPAHLR